jgi:hypothetical protein
MLFENLCNSDEWRERCEALAPESGLLNASETADAILTNYFSQEAV